MREPTVEMVTVTPAMAQEWLNTSIYERQRKRAQWQVNRLATEILNGTMIAGTQIHFCIMGSDVKLVNGQHTLAAIVKAKRPFPLSVLKTEVDDADEPGRIYGRHDVHRGRTPHDAFLAQNLAEKLGLSQHEVNAFATGLKWVENDFRRVSVTLDPTVAMSRDRAVDDMMKWSDIAKLYFDATRDAQVGMKGAFRRGPVVSVGLATFKYQRAKAEAFWLGAAKDDRLDRDDPRHAMNKFLLSHSSGYGDQMAYMRNIASAWNKFFDGGKLRLLKMIDSGKTGLTLRGTPYKAVAIRRHRTQGDAEMLPLSADRTTSADGETRT